MNDFSKLLFLMALLQTLLAVCDTDMGVPKLIIIAISIILVIIAGLFEGMVRKEKYEREEQRRIREYELMNNNKLNDEENLNNSESFEKGKKNI